MADFSYFLPFCIILYLVEIAGRRTQFGRSSSAGLLPEGRKNADGFLGEAHVASLGLIVHAHFVKDEEEGVTSPFL